MYHPRPSFNHFCSLSLSLFSLHDVCDLRVESQYTHENILSLCRLLKSPERTLSVLYSCTMGDTTSLHTVPKKVPYLALRVAEAFNALTPQERLYAHYLQRASWAGLAICAEQLSVESRPLLQRFYALFKAHPPASLRTLVTSPPHSILEESFQHVLEYAALLYTNSGNYQSFGDSKFIPRCPPSVLSTVFSAAGQPLDRALLEAVYDLSPSKLSLGFPTQGVTAYYSPDITKEDVELANAFLSSKGINGVNTRVFKLDVSQLEIRVAAKESKTIPAETFQGRSITLRYGDFSPEMSLVAEALTHAIPYAANETQKKMLAHYVDHFTHGDVNDHKQSQREWVKDKGPAVETNIGFIETYRDPSGVRGEWEGFVSIVNRKQSEVYSALVLHAEYFIGFLPWGKDFEKDAFSSPDFTSLDILTFASSGIPAGICIPNYDDIRQEDGFKNVYLSNVVNAFQMTEKITHVTDADWEAIKLSFVDAMSIGVGVHELLGHGTGKLFHENEDKTRNFDPSTIDPLSQKPVSSWYKPGETFSSVFGGINNAYEECRAEAVALFLGAHPHMLQLFGIKDQEAQERTRHVQWLTMVRGGLAGLEFYSPDGCQWRQAHCRARFCILKTLLQCNPENPLVTITPNEKEGIIIEIDAKRICTEGTKAIGDLLVHLNVYKALANAKEGSAYFSALTEVDETFLKYREIIIAHRKPRKQFVQPMTVLTPDGKDVKLVEFEGSVEGVIESLVKRHEDIPL